MTLTETIGESTRALTLIAQRSSDARVRVVAWSRSLTWELEHHPLRTLSVALGAGFLLGGGLFSRLTFRLVGTGLRLGLRMAVLPLIAQSVVRNGIGQAGLRR
jgi:hypothetical protein